jgi:hypothetical protein
MIKSIAFKVKGDCPITKDVIKEYKEHYNRCSEWIKNNLTSITIGEIGKFLQDIMGKTHGYIKVALSDEWKDKPMYYLFTDKYDTNHANNLLYYFIQENNLDRYEGNILNIPSYYYRRVGYFKLVVSNYRTKIRTLNCKIKRKKVDMDSTSEDIENQVMYEVINHSLNKKTDWDNYISYIENIEIPNIDSINRYKLLRDYFCENENVIKNKIELLSIEQLKNFGGCIMKQHINTMILNIKRLKIEEKENSLGFILHLPLNKKQYQIELWGNRQIKKGTKESNKILVDFINTYGENVVFTIKNNELYAIISYECNFEKEETNFEKIVGLDINFKHALFVSSEQDSEQLNGYINLYKYILSHNEFTNLLTEDERKDYEELSKIVTFCPFEYQLLFSRYDKTSKFYEKEQIFSKILYSLQKKLKYENRTKEYIYVSCVNKLRAKYKSYFILKEKYYEKQSEYDIEMGFVDDSTESKESMDKRRFENPFINTLVANELLEKMNNVQQDINGCLKNIINYIYKVFEQNGYNITGLENLENSNFEKRQVLPSIKSILKYHKLENQNINDIKTSDKIKEYIENGYYEFTTNENNEIVDAKYTAKGEIKVKNANFINLMMKALHFASIKDEFVLLSNNGKNQIALVPSEYTSQMDSIDHCIYMTVNNKGKVVKVDKRKVRTKQERHINGLNADFNAANNIKYMVSNEKWRNAFCTQKKAKYNTPALDATKKGQFRILEDLKKLKATKLLEMEK